jgi:DMSO reductase iron-sulfur subunit
MLRLGFYIDTSSCSGCKTCQVACQDKNDLKPGQHWRRIYEIEAGEWVKEAEKWTGIPHSWYVSISCNHCSEPSCVDACPTGAMTITEEGVVVVNHDRCMGCGYCSWACPYDAPRMNKEAGKMSKCDFCIDKIRQGLNPVCVDSCPMRALEFGPLDELRKKYGDERNIFPLPDSAITSPSVVIKKHKDSYKESKAYISNREEVTDA